MARTRKAIQPLDLYKFDVLIEDRSAKSDYFRLSQFDGYLYGGRNSILIGGSTVLRPRTKVLVEILDKDGTAVYSNPIPTFIEGDSRLIQIEVYEDTPIGQGKIVILGCADTYLDGTPIPPEWRNKYNVRWMGNVTISPLIENKTPIRFSTTPSMTIEEKFYLPPSSSRYSSRASASIDLQLSTKFYNVFPNGYLLKATGPTTNDRFFAKYLDGVVTGSIKFNATNGPETAAISIPISKIYNSTLAESEGTLIYTDKQNLIRAGFISSSGQYQTNIDPYGIIPVTTSINIRYDEITTQATGSRVSFSKIRIVDLSTVSGEINKVRFSYKPSTEQGEFVLLGDVRTNVAELLAKDTGSIDGKTTRIAETGKFKEIVISDYWYAATMSLAKNQLNFVPPTYYNTSSLVTAQNVIQQCCTDLLDSVNATPQIINGKYKDDRSYFIGTKKSNTVQLFPRSEYTLSFKALVAKESSSIWLDQSNYSMEVYLVPESGSSDTRIIDTNTLGQLIGTVTPQTNFLSQNFDTVELNFTPKITTSGNFGLRFIIYGGYWNIADVSLKTAQEPFFSPDELDALVPNVNYINSLLTFKAEFLDINNNSIGVTTLSIPTYFTGSDSQLTATNLPAGLFSSSAQVGLNQISGSEFNPSYTSLTFPYSVNVSGSLNIQRGVEKVTTVASGLNSTINYNILSSSVLYYTSDSTGNWTVNFRGNGTTALNDVLQVGQSITLVLLATNGSPGYYATTHQIDGSSISPQWQGSTVPSSGVTNGTDIYSYSIIKTGNATFKLFAAKTEFS